MFKTIFVFISLIFSSFLDPISFRRPGPLNLSNPISNRDSLYFMSRNRELLDNLNNSSIPNPLGSVSANKQILGRFSSTLSSSSSSY